MRTRICCRLFIGVMLLSGMPSMVLANEQLVLIVSARSAVDSLDSSSVRKLFLGLTVTRDGSRLVPVLNEADPGLRELFLQNIVSMSDSTYDRYVLRLALIRGQTQPKMYKNEMDLLEAVAADPVAVGYAWAKDVVQDPRIRILRVVWHD